MKLPAHATHKGADLWEHVPCPDVIDALRNTNQTADDGRSQKNGSLCKRQFQSTSLVDRQALTADCERGVMCQKNGRAERERE